MLIVDLERFFQHDRRLIHAGALIFRGFGHEGLPPLELLRCQAVAMMMILLQAAPVLKHRVDFRLQLRAIFEKLVVARVEDDQVRLITQHFL